MHLPRSHFLSWCRRASSAAAARHARAECIADGANLQLQGLQETLAKVVAALQGTGEYIPNEGVKATMHCWCQIARDQNNGLIYAL